MKVDYNQNIFGYLQSILNIAIKKMLDTINIDREEYRKCLDLPFEEYNEYILKIIWSNKTTLNLLWEKMSEDVMINYRRYIYTLSERAWLINNSLLFIMDIEKALKLPPVDKERAQNINWDIITNSMITFSSSNKHEKIYLPYLIEYFDTDYKRVIKEETSKVYKYRFNTMIKGDMYEIYSMSFVPNRLPRLFYEKEDNRLINDNFICDKCNNNHFESETIIENSKKERKTRKICLLSEKRQSQCLACSKAELPAGIVLSILAYISDMYEKRHSLTRKNSKHIGNYKDKGEISLVCSSKNEGIEYREVNLLEYSKQEGKYDQEYFTRCGITHSNHASPKEHYRRPHIRHYKSGKIVEVKGAVVNKGNGKIIYKI